MADPAGIHNGSLYLLLQLVAKIGPREEGKGLCRCRMGHDVDCAASESMVPSVELESSATFFPASVCRFALL